MNKNLELNLVGHIKKIDELKSEIDKFHPLLKEVEDRIFQKYRLDWNYNSNAIEGNSLNYGETYAFLMHGITASGKPLKDYLDIRGHNEAINYLIDLVRNKEELTEAIIRELHKVILVESYETDALTQNGKLTTKTVTLGAYKTVPNHVKTATGEVHYFASPEETPAKMYDLMNWYRNSKNDKEIHPVVLAAIFHHRFSEIHPFDDGNGRLSRLLMNLILMQNNFPPAIIKIKDRNNYYLALSQADAGDAKKFIEYVAGVLIHSMEIYLKGARGESIEEPDDLDKEIILLKKELEGLEDRFEKSNSDQTRIETVKKSFIPFLETINQVVTKIRDLFAVLNISYNFFVNDDFKYHSQKENNEFSALMFEKDFLSVSQKNVSTIHYFFNLSKYKKKESPFSLTIECYIEFGEYDFVIYSNITDYLRNLKNLRLSHASFNAHWIERISYDSQLIEKQILDAKQILSKEVIAFIKEQLKG